MPETMSVETEGHVALVTLCDKTMKPAFFEEVGDVFGALGADPEVRAIVVRGPDKCFTYGLDLMAMFREHGKIFGGPTLAGPRTELLGLVRRWQRAFTTLAEIPTPTIAAVHGWCIGGGVDLITACDIRVAAADAKFSVRETKIAIVADLGTLQRLPAIVGQGHARELAFTGKDIDAERARTIGLVNDVYPDREATVAAALDMAGEIAKNAPLTVGGVKQVLNQGLGRTPAEGLEYVAVFNAAFVASEDLGEAVSAFTAKREPKYRGR